MNPLHEGTLKKIINKLLFEAVQNNRIITSIKNRQINKIYYDGDNTIRAGYRSIEVYCFGINYSGNAVIRAWQREGVSDTPYGDGYDKLKEKPGWRMFRLDGIKSFNNTNLKFDASERFLLSNRPRYNAHDRDMQTIYYALEPDGESPKSDGPVDTTLVVNGDNTDNNTTPETSDNGNNYNYVIPPKVPPIGTDKPFTTTTKQSMFKSDAENPLFGSERDEEEKNFRT